jgi:serine/threonine-protein kinase
MAGKAEYITPLVSLALERKVLGKKQYNTAKELLRKSRRIGLQTSIEEIIVRQGFLVPEQLEELRQILDLAEDGTSFGAYRLVNKIGEGGMGKVYEAVHEVMNRTVALKVINYEHTRDTSGATRFFQEIRALAKLNHPNIVTIYDCGRVGRRYYYAMEYLRGQSLKGLVDSRKMLPETEALSIIRATARALAHAHANNVIHRDVKPENILLTAKGRPKLTDFGLVMHHDADHMTLTQEGFMVGSYYYVSPEQLDGVRDVDGRTDVYSLGATLYYALTGGTPYTGTTPQELVAQTLAGAFTSPRRYNHLISTRTENLVRRMMARNRDRRLANMQKVVDEIEGILRPNPWKRRIKRALLILGLVGLGIIVENLFGIVTTLFG